MKLFVTEVNGYKLSTFVTKISISVFAVLLDSLLKKKKLRKKK